MSSNKLQTSPLQPLPLFKHIAYRAMILSPSQSLYENVIVRMGMIACDEIYMYRMLRTIRLGLVSGVMVRSILLLILLIALTYIDLLIWRKDPVRLVSRSLMLRAIPVMIIKVLCCAVVLGFLNSTIRKFEQQRHSNTATWKQTTHLTDRKYMQSLTAISNPNNAAAKKRVSIVVFHLPCYLQK
jgi:hypothetical protein